MIQDRGYTTNYTGYRINYTKIEDTEQMIQETGYGIK